MEFLTSLLSGLLGILSSAGFVIDSVARNAIRSQLESADVLEVRIDNAPSHQILQGRVQQVRVAGRGLFLEDEIRVAVLELETDAIAFDPTRFRQGRLMLEQPLQAGVRLKLTQDDMNRALRSSFVTERLDNLGPGLLPGSGANQLQRYDFVEPELEFLDADRVRLQVVMRERGTNQDLRLVVETGLHVIGGRQIQLVNPTILANDEAVPAQLLNQFIAGLNRQLDLEKFERLGVTARLLQLEVSPGALELAAFIRVEPSLTASGN